MRKNDRIDLAVVTNEPFPVGMAATNRLISYSKELGQKYRVKVYVAKPTERLGNVRNFLINGCYKNIHYIYANGTTVWPFEGTKICKMILLFVGIVKIFRFLQRDKPYSLILVSNSTFLIVSMWLITKILGIYYFQEKSEYPPINKFNRVTKYLYLSLYSLFDGMIVMTNELRIYFERLGQQNVFHLPMSVEHDRFAIQRDLSITDKYFAYCGGGNYDRDGLLNIIEAFITFKKSFPEYKLYVIGDLKDPSEYLNKVIDIVKKSESNKNILFLGKKPSYEIPKLLVNAKCLIMAPPENFKSGGFPTKLGEYLSTGVPVICTRVSEIPLYLSENCALIVQPNNKSELIDAMERIVNETSKCRIIGKTGQTVAFTKFSVRTYLPKLEKFLKLEK